MSCFPSMDGWYCIGLDGGQEPCEPFWSKGSGPAVEKWRAARSARRGMRAPPVLWHWNEPFEFPPGYEPALDRYPPGYIPGGWRHGMNRTGYWYRMDPDFTVKLVRAWQA